MTYLTIAITSLIERASLLEELVAEFQRQMPNPGDVEILIEVDNRETPVGLKRDRMNEAAQGAFIVHWDDDDWPSEAYLELVLAALKANPAVDVVNYPAIRIDAPGHEPVLVTYHVDKVFPMRFSIKNPIRIDLARSVLNGRRGWGEDMAYQAELDESVETEATINRPLYFYMPNFWKAVTNRDLDIVKEMDRERWLG